MKGSFNGDQPLAAFCWKVMDAVDTVKTYCFPRYPAIPPEFWVFDRYILRVQSYQTSARWFGCLGFWKLQKRHGLVTTLGCHRDPFQDVGSLAHHQDDGWIMFYRLTWHHCIIPGRAGHPEFVLCSIALFHSLSSKLGAQFSVLVRFWCIMICTVSGYV